jgi:hypothetical protein
VLMSQQSTDQFTSALETISAARDGSAAVLSLSPQSRASLAVHFGLGPTETHRRLTTFLQALGVACVVDTTLSRELALLAATDEFMQAYAAAGSPTAAEVSMAQKRVAVTIGTEETAEIIGVEAPGAGAGSPAKGGGGGDLRWCCRCWCLRAQDGCVTPRSRTRLPSRSCRACGHHRLSWVGWPRPTCGSASGCRRAPSSTTRR